MKLDQPLLCSKKPLLWKDKSLHLMEILGGMDYEETASLFNLKGKLLEETYLLYHDNNSRKRLYEPLACYDGAVYESLGRTEFSQKEIDYLDEHLVILSAMYGVLEPSMGIWPYRLDFKTRPKGIDLYKYWSQEVLSYFENQDQVVNLASKEFSSLLKPLAERLLNIHFFEGEKRAPSYNAKKARGLMAEILARRRVLDVGLMKEIRVDGFVFDPLRSDDRNYFYIKGGSK